MIQTIPSFDKLIAQLGFLLVVDHCSRNCSHCQAFGERSPVERIPFDELENISFMIKRAAAIAQISVPIPLHCWRVSDPLDYYCKTGSGWKTCYDVAELWRRVFGQGLYVVTNGSEGTKIGREAVLGLSAQPDLLNQIKLTITPYDQEWGTPKYKADILWDLQQLHLLWQYPCAQRPNELLFRVNAKCSKCSKNELRQFLLELLREVGYSFYKANKIIADPQKIAFKPIYDLGNTVNASPPAGVVALPRDVHGIIKKSPAQRGEEYFGIRPDGRIFVVNMYRFSERDVVDESGAYVRFWEIAPGNPRSLASSTSESAYSHCNLR